MCVIIVVFFLGDVILLIFVYNYLIGKFVVGGYVYCGC